MTRVRTMTAAAAAGVTVSLALATAGNAAPRVDPGSPDAPATSAMATHTMATGSMSSDSMATMDMTASTSATQPQPEGYVNQSGPAVVHLPQTQISPDRVVAGRIPLHSELTASGGTSTAPAEVPTPGTWSTERNIERMMHFFALPSSPTADQYLACAGSGNLPDNGAGAPQPKFECYRVDRVANTQVNVPLPDDWFCSAAVHDANGDVVTAGGTRAYPKLNTEVAGTWGGSASTYRYATQSGAITPLGDMASRRWYPNLFKNQDDDIFVQGGQDNGVQQPTWEVMRHGSSSWATLPFQRAMNSYADMQLIGTDTTAYTGAGINDQEPFILDLNTFTSTPTPGLRDEDSRKASSGFLAYPAQDQKVLVVGGGPKSDFSSTDKVDMIDYSVWPKAVPTFVPRAPLPTPMMFVQMVNLPNGQTFAAGGSSAWRTGDVLWAGFYDVASDTWQYVTPPTIGRDYHSNMWVNSDGTVSLSGGNPGRNIFHSEVETYRPWYMGRTRPSLDAASLPRIKSGQSLSNLAKGGSYKVQVSSEKTAPIGSFTLDAARAATHVSSDSDQAMFSVPFKQAAKGALKITIPDTATLTPGAYRLTAVTTAGVPSSSVWVKVV